MSFFGLTQFILHDLVSFDASHNVKGRLNILDIHKKVYFTRFSVVRNLFRYPMTLANNSSTLLPYKQTLNRKPNFTNAIYCPLWSLPLTFRLIMIWIGFTLSVTLINRHYTLMSSSWSRLFLGDRMMREINSQDYPNPCSLSVIAISSSSSRPNPKCCTNSWK